MDEYRTALVLQGGGALGAYEYGVIKALYESRRGFRPTIITGTSIGAINAAILVGARQNPIETLGKVWIERLSALAPLLPLARRLGEQIVPSGIQKLLYPFGAYGIYGISPEEWCMVGGPASVYSAHRLREVLENTVDLQRLNQSPTHLVISALDVATGECKQFDNREGLSIDRIVASKSLPPLFPPLRIGDDYYWDGGLFMNTPLSPAINCLEKCEPILTSSGS